ncbi:MAG: hypothetical protein ACE5IT_03840 [bacterium]
MVFSAVSRFGTGEGEKDRNLKSARASKTERITGVVMMSYNARRIILIGLFLVAISFVFSVSPAAAANRYWVGQTNWDNPSNWSNTSGGSGGAGVPGTSDNAIFDGGNTNSCQIDISSTVASVIIYSTYTATLSINPGNSLTTSGSFEIAGGTFTTNGELLEVGSYSQTGTIFNAGGSTITCNGNFSVTGGTFNTGSSTLILKATNGDATFTGDGYTFNNVIFQSTGTVARTWTLGGGNITFNGNFELKAEGSGNLTVTAAINNPELNILGNVDYTGTGTGSESISMGNGTWTVSGNVNLTGGTVNAGASTLVMDGNNKGLAGAGQTLNNLTISGTIGANSDVTINGTLTLDASKTLQIADNYTVKMAAGSLTALNGTMDGPGTLELLDSAGANLGTSGTLRTKVRFHTESANVTVPARTYGGGIEFYNDSATDHTATLGTAGSQTINCSGNFFLAADGVGNILVDANTYDPTIDIEGNIDYAGTGAGTESISMGSGTWYVGGYIDFTGGTVTAGPSTVILDGTTSGYSALGTGMDQPVNALTVYNNGLIAGGDFTQAGGESANQIAKWDGSSWSALGTGMDSDVLALTVYNNELIAGGWFWLAGGESANYIAKWNGSSWSALGTGMENVVLALTVYNNELIAGGRFTQAGGVSANRIAKWDGSSWSALGTGMNDYVYALTVYNNELIAGGSFTQAGGESANQIAKWNGSSWSSLGTGMNDTVYALTVYNNELIAGGSFTQAGGGSSNRIAKWNGSSWSALGTGMNLPVLALTVHNKKLIAGGVFTQAGGGSANRIAKWDGSSWSALGTGMNDEVYALTVYNNELIPGGQFTQAAGVSASTIAQYTTPAFITSSGQSLNNLTIENTSSDGVTFSDNVTALTFTATTGDGNLYFTSGSTATFTNIALNGQAESSRIVLRSTSPSTAYCWNVSGNQSVSYVDVQNCDASLGNTIDATDGTSYDAGRNVNWVFGAQNRYWVAATTGNWSDSNNWSSSSGGSGGAMVPDSDDTAIFDGAGLRNCNIDIQASVTDVIIYSTHTATVSINSGNSLTTSGSFEIAGGTFTTNGELLEVGSYSQTGGIFNAGGSTITCNGDFSVTGGNFNSGSSTFVLNGSSSQTMTMDGNSLNILEITNSSSDGVYFADNLTCSTFTATTPNTHLYFTGGSTATLTNITLNGQAIASRIVLRSTSPGTAWYLTVTGTQSVFYVDAQDSDASGGQTILATDSEDAGRNIKWVFQFTDTVEPREPCGIKGRFLNSKIFEVSWSKVTKDIKGENENVEGYNVYRATSTEGLWIPIKSLGNNASSSTDAVNGQVNYYRIKAEDIGHNESKGSMIVDTTEDINVIAVADDDARNQKKMSKEINSILYKGNLYDEDIKIILQRKNTEERDSDTITCYDIKAVKADSENEIEGFKFNGGRAEISLHYQVKDGKIGDSIPASEAPKRLAVYWFNGIEWIKLGGEVDKDRQTVTVRTRHLSKFAIKKTFNPGGFRVTSVWPKIFTPYGEGIHKTVKIYFEGTDPDEAVVGKIFDITGALVYNNLPRGDDENSLVWDGRFRNGRMARSGIYIYQIESRGKVINGTIVLAK